LRSYIYEFIRQFAPGLQRSEIEQALAGDTAD
jgi:hypothetical protein